MRKINIFNLNENEKYNNEFSKYLPDDEEIYAFLETDFWKKLILKSTTKLGKFFFR